MPNVDFIKQKAREISYSLIRVCFYIKRIDLRLSIERLSFELLENSARLSADNNPDNLNKSLASISVLDSLVRLGHSIYEIEPVNATVLVRELDGLNSAIRQFGNYPYGEEQLPNIESFFSKVPVAVEPQLQEQAQDQKQQGFSGGDKVNLMDFSSDAQPARPFASLNESEENDNTARESGNSAINAAIRSPYGRSLEGRQPAIINKIKDSNPSAGSGQAGCRLKDLVAEFPDVSERTLRYDLQRLCGQGIIERVGNGGPASYYRFTSQN